METAEQTVPTHQILYGLTWWGLTALADPPLDGLGRLAAEGYRIIEASAQHWADDSLRAAAERHGLIPVVQCPLTSAADLQPALRLARHLGAVLVNAHAGNPYLDSSAAAALINDLYDLAGAAGVQLIVETHRGQMTQDLFRTAQLTRTIPRLRFNLDVSHYVVAASSRGVTDDLKPWLDPILDRTQMIHGRISNGQQVQVGLDEGTRDLAASYVAVWAEAMRRWRRTAPPGSAFIFTPELGPPPYAITGPDGRELTDRWQQSAAVRALGAEAWVLSAKPAPSPAASSIP